MPRSATGTQIDARSAEYPRNLLVKDVHLTQQLTASATVLLREIPETAVVHSTSCILSSVNGRHPSAYGGNARILGSEASNTKMANFKCYRRTRMLSVLAWCTQRRHAATNGLTAREIWNGACNAKSFDWIAEVAISNVGTKCRLCTKEFCAVGMLHLLVLE